jgi:ferric-dicitrate binding protein FerR (iron transport regulator)
MSEERHDDPIATLIRAAGKRPQIDAEQVARVRAAVHEEWRGEIRRGRTRRWSLAAAAVAAILAGVLLLVPQRGQSVLETRASETRAMLWNGKNLRLHPDTRVVLLTENTARLERGTIDIATQRPGSNVTIETPFGAVRDIGTRFEVRLSSTDVTVRVREGKVELRGAIASAGEVLTATRTEVTRARIEPELIVLEGMRLEDVLARVAREKGLALDWSAPASYRSVVLRGDVPFSPDEALDAATAAAGVTWRVTGDRLVIEDRAR